MITVYHNNEKLEIFEETFNSLKEAKSYIEGLAEEGIQNAQVFVHTGKHDWSKNYTYEVHWTTETDMFSILFEKEAMAKAFYSQMYTVYQNDWHSVYLFEHVGQGRLIRLGYAVKV
jgi:hypothetical protein